MRPANKTGNKPSERATRIGRQTAEIIDRIGAEKFDQIDALEFDAPSFDIGGTPPPEVQAAMDKAKKQFEATRRLNQAGD